MSTGPWRRIVVFLVLTYSLSSIFYWKIIAGGMEALPVLGLMWCPGVAAIVTRLVFQRNLRGIGWGWGATRWQLLSYVLPPALCLVVYGLVWITGLGGVSASALMAAIGQKLPLGVALALLATIGFVQGVVFALGEEIGWRGLLVPELAGVTSFTHTALLSGAAWAVYHYPLILFSEYNSGGPKWYSLLVFTWMAIAASFGFAWIRLRSGSLWTAVILHASHNLFVQTVFDSLTVDRGITKYITTEFGAGLAIAYTVVAWVCWKKRGELTRSEERTRTQRIHQVQVGTSHQGAQYVRVRRRGDGDLVASSVLGAPVLGALRERVEALVEEGEAEAALARRRSGSRVHGVQEILARDPQRVPGTDSAPHPGTWHPIPIAR
jgi:membrane protease YdiL (CAAX protease family)